MKATAHIDTTNVHRAEPGKVKKASKKQHASLVNPHQISIFEILEQAADDILAMSDAAKATEQLERQTSEVIARTPELSKGMTADERQAVDFARFMRSVNIPADKIQESLAEVTPNAQKVMAQVSSIEASLASAGASKNDKNDKNDKGDQGKQSGYDFDDSNDEQVTEEVSGDPGYSESMDNADGAEFTDKPRHETQEYVAGNSRGANPTALFLSSLHGKRFDPPTAEQERKLGLCAMTGDIAARNELVERNMRFMASMARSFIKTGRPYEDLIQAGSEGLITAAAKFNPNLGRFTTVAAIWIRQRIQRSVASDCNMPLPAYLPGEEARLLRLASESTTPEEKERLEGRASKAAQRLESRRRNTLSLDSQGSDGDDDGVSMLESLASEATGIEEATAQRQFIARLEKYANELGNERATNVFKMRLGMHPDHLGESCTLADISEVYKLSRERVRQIYTESAQDIYQAMVYWAGGAKNLPEGFKRGLLNPGKS